MKIIINIKINHCLPRETIKLLIPNIDMVVVGVFFMEEKSIVGIVHISPQRMFSLNYRLGFMHFTVII